MSLSYPAHEGAAHRVSTPVLVLASPPEAEVKERLPRKKQRVYAGKVEERPAPANPIPRGKLWKLNRKGLSNELHERFFEFRSPRQLVYFKKEDCSDKAPKVIDLTGTEARIDDTHQWGYGFLVIRISKPAQRTLAVYCGHYDKKEDKIEERKRWVAALYECAKGRLFVPKE